MEGVVWNRISTFDNMAMGESHIKKTWVYA